MSVMALAVSNCLIGSFLYFVTCAISKGILYEDWKFYKLQKHNYCLTTYSVCRFYMQFIFSLLRTPLPFILHYFHFRRLRKGRQFLVRFRFISSCKKDKTQRKDINPALSNDDNE